MPHTKLACHRGANRIAPENTYAAAEGAIALGADFIEVDVRMSSDGVAYILHDETVDRTTNGTGAIENMTSAELDALDAGSWFGSQFAGERIPKLADYLAWLQGKCGIYIEIKKAPVALVRDLVYQHGFQDDSYFFSFDQGLCAEMIRAAPAFPVMALLRETDGIADIADRGFRIVELLAYEMSPGNLAEARERGLQVQAFHPADDAEIFRAMIELEIDYANVDHPETFMRVRREIDAAG